MENPEKYVPHKKPPHTPAIRIAIVGPRGAGKSIQARHLAEKLDLFHVKFRDRLQEMIIGKIKKPVGPEFEEEKDEEEEAYVYYFITLILILKFIIKFKC